MALGLLVFHRGHLVSSDEIGLFEMTRSLAERGSLEVPRQRHVFRGRDGRLYHQYAVGQAVLALPFYGLGSLAGRVLPLSWRSALASPDVSLPDRRVEGGIELFFVALYPFVATGALVGLFFLFERQLGVSWRHAVAATLLLGTCTYVALMSTFFMRHTTAALGILGSLLCFHAWRRTERLADLLLGSALASGVLLVRLADGVAGLALAGYLGWILLEKGAFTRPLREQAKIGLALIAPALVAASVHVALNYYRWGQWLGSPMVEEGRFGAPLRVSGYANLASPGMSVFVFSPLLLLLPWTLPVLYRRHRAECLTIVSLSLVFWTVFSLYEGWPGLFAMPGPRYLLATVPLLLLSLGPWLDASTGRLKWAAVAILAALGALVQLAFMATDWSELVRTSGWLDLRPLWGFLFQPEASPPARAIRALLEGRFDGMWIVGLARGRTGQPPHPGAAGAVLLVWLGLLALLLHGLVRELRRTEVGSGRPGCTSAG